MIALSVDWLMSTRFGAVWVIVALPPTTTPFLGLADAAPTISAEADTPASRPVIRLERALRWVGSAPSCLPAARRRRRRRSGAERAMRRWRAMRRAETTGGRSELALRHPVDVRVLRIEDVGELQRDRRRRLVLLGFGADRAGEHQHHHAPAAIEPAKHDEAVRHLLVGQDAVGLVAGGHEVVAQQVGGADHALRAGRLGFGGPGRVDLDEFLGRISKDIGYPRAPGARNQIGDLDGQHGGLFRSVGLARDLLARTREILADRLADLR